jgi:hypothetical protein
MLTIFEKLHPGAAMFSASGFGSGLNASDKFLCLPNAVCVLGFKYRMIIARQPS